MPSIDEIKPNSIYLNYHAISRLVIDPPNQFTPHTTPNGQHILPERFDTISIGDFAHNGQYRPQFQEEEVEPMLVELVAKKVR
jgi:hypothetical protein